VICLTFNGPLLMKGRMTPLNASANVVSLDYFFFWVLMHKDVEMSTTTNRGLDPPSLNTRTLDQIQVSEEEWFVEARR